MKLQEIFKDNQNKGFTFIEMLITISMTVAIFTLAIPIYSNLSISSQLNENASLLVQNLRITREKSINRFNNSSYGIKLQTNRYIIYQGDSYSTRDDTYDRVVDFGSVVSASSDLVDNEINFSKSFGMPNNIGTINLLHETGNNRLVEINKFGMVQEK